MRTRWLFNCIKCLPLIITPLGLISCVNPSQNYDRPRIDAIKEYERALQNNKRYPRSYVYYRGNSIMREDFNPYADVKAHKVGDIVYVIVYESIDALAQMQTQTSNQAQFNSAVASFFGIPTSTLRNLSAQYQTQTGSSYSGATQQKGMLTTRLAAYVKKVYPNGNLLIEAYRYIYLNEMGHKIILRGIIRPEDISPDNTVDSSHIANLEIIYNGKGYAVDASSPGWFTRFLAAIWPF